MAWAISDTEDLLQTVEQVAKDGIIADFEVRRDGVFGFNKKLVPAAVVTMDPRAHCVLEKAQAHWIDPISLHIR